MMKRVFASRGVGNEEVRLPAIGPPRFELGQAVPKTAVLPLHHGPVAGGRSLNVTPSGSGLDGLVRASTKDPMGTRKIRGGPTGQDRMRTAAK